jgi:hypothetical protein
MIKKKIDPADALKAVTTALEPLPDAEKQWVLQSAASRWTLTVQVQNPAGGGGGPGAGVIGAQNDNLQAALTSKDARAFMRAKKPATDVQRVACLAYFHMKTTGQRTFTSEDIQSIHTDSGGSKMNFTRALDNATRRSRYISTIRGREKQLTTLGEDVVDALPDQKKVAEVEETAQHSRRGRRRKGKATKEKRARTV